MLWSRLCATEKAADAAGGGIEMAFKEEMAAVEQVDLGVRDVVGKGERARGTEDLVVRPHTAMSGTPLARS